MNLIFFFKNSENPGNIYQKKVKFKYLDYFKILKKYKLN